MKKYIIIATAALVAMCACTKNELNTNVPDQEIAFQVANYLNQTKATTDTLAYYADGYFGTFVWQVAEGAKFNDNGAVKSKFMDNVAIYSHSNVWKAANTYYWPKTGSLTFASYSPVSTKADCACTALCDSSAVITIKNWQVDTLNSKQAKDFTEDLMWADVMKDQTANTNPAKYNDFNSVSEGVPTLFHHALAKVNIKAKVSETPSTSAYEYAVYINNIKVDGLLYKGNYSVDATKVDGTAASKGWTPTTDRGGDPSIYSQSTSFKQGEKYAAADSVLTVDGSLYVDNYFVLPQDLTSGDAVIEIEYTIVTYDPNDNDKIILVEKTSTTQGGNLVEIKDMGLNSWGENQNITYTVTIVPVGPDPDDPDWDEILFDPAVVGWDDKEPITNITF